MCSFVLSVLNVQALSHEEREKVEKELRERRDTINGQLQNLNTQLDKVNQALSIFDQKRR
jgi:hypothetical protein